MSDHLGVLAGFAYGEDLEGVVPRSLGYRLLTPVNAESWCAEVEGLARRLQAAPYSDHWPPTDLFCSVLLSEGRRVIALARYGLADHTPSQRRGGLELIGVVAPAHVEVRAALAIYHWLRQRRDAVDDLHQLGGRFILQDILAVSVVPPPHADPVPVLPVRLWQEGALLFAASSPSDPDHRLPLLEQASGAAWQWLPLVGPDFPLHVYAQRGPLIAWTPHLTGVALKLEPKSGETPVSRPARRGHGARLVSAVLLLLLVGLPAANLWSTVLLLRKTAEPVQNTATPPPASQPLAKTNDAGRDRFVAAVRELLLERGGTREGEAEKSRLLTRYERLVRIHRDLRVRDDSEQDKITVATLSVLAERGASRIEEEVRKALSNKGFSERVIQAACAHVREHYRAETNENP